MPTNGLRNNGLFNTNDEGELFHVTEKLLELQMTHSDVFHAFIAKCKHPELGSFTPRQADILRKWSTSYQGFLQPNGIIPPSVRKITLDVIRETPTGGIEIKNAMGGLIRARL